MAVAAAETMHATKTMCWCLPRPATADDDDGAQQLRDATADVAADGVDGDVDGGSPSSARPWPANGGPACASCSRRAESERPRQTNALPATWWSGRFWSAPYPWWWWRPEPSTQANSWCRCVARRVLNRLAIVGRSP